MAFQQSEIGARCEAAIRQAAGGALSEAEVKEMVGKVVSKAAELRRQQAILSDPEVILKAVAKIADDEKVAALVEKRSRALNVLAKKQRFGFYDQHAGDEAGAVQALILGKEGPEFGYGRSTEVQYRVERDRLLTPLNLELEKAKLDKATGITDRGFQLDLAKEMARASGGAEQATGNSIAEGIGKIFSKYLDLARTLRNDVGAWTRSLDGFITKQSHDMIKVRGKGKEADYVAWRDHILPRLDEERTFTDVLPEDRESYLRHVWNGLATGIHLKATEGDWLAGFKGGTSNIAKRASQERSLHFKDATAWFEYNERFGVGTIHETVAQSLDHAARDIALMKQWGTNPRAALDADVRQLLDRAEMRGDLDQMKALRASKLGDMFGIVDGTADIPANATAARWGRNFRAVESIVKLNGGLVSSFPDIAARAATLRWNGQGVLESLGKGVFAVLKGRPELEQRELLNRIAAVADGAIGEMIGRFNSGEALNGTMAKAVSLQMKLNGQRFWTDRLMAQTVTDLATTLGFHRASAFAELPERLKLTLGRYGIDDAKWDFARARTVEKDGTHYLVSDASKDLSDAEVRGMIGEKATDIEVRRWRDDMESTWRGYFIDQSREALTEPNAYVKYIQTWGGTAPGSVAGEVARATMQFKSFSVGTFTRHLNREWNRGATPDAAGIASMIAGMTVLGYVSSVAKDLLSNRTPKEWADPFASHKDFGQDVKIFLDALVKGGGLGILGDMLFTDYNKAGSPGLAAVLGPIAGSVSSLLSLYTDSKDMAAGITDHNLASKSMQILDQHAPVVNLWYLKAAWEYLFLHRLQDAVNPGYMRRYERRMERENRQTPILSVR